MTMTQEESPRSLTFAPATPALIALIAPFPRS